MYKRKIFDARFLALFFSRLYISEKKLTQEILRQEFFAPLGSSWQCKRKKSNTKFLHYFSPVSIRAKRSGAVRTKTTQHGQHDHASEEPGVRKMIQVNIRGFFVLRRTILVLH